jgi:hypothetical protein
MVAKAREIEVPAGSELARLIDEWNAFPIILVKDGIRYRLEHATDRDAGAPDHSTVEQADDDPLERIIGAWADLDIEALKAELRLAREEGSRPLDWPGFSR